MYLVIDEELKSHPGEKNEKHYYWKSDGNEKTVVHQISHYLVSSLGFSLESQYNSNELIARNIKLV